MAGQRAPESYRYRHADKMLDTTIGKKVQQYLLDEFEFQVRYLCPHFFSDPQSQDKLWRDMIEDNIVDGGPLFPELECAPTDSLREAVTGTERIFTQVRDRLNGRKDRVGKSYSKYLIIPLFKKGLQIGLVKYILSF